MRCWEIGTRYLRPLRGTGGGAAAIDRSTRVEPEILERVRGAADPTAEPLSPKARRRRRRSRAAPSPGEDERGGLRWRSLQRDEAAGRWASLM